MRSCNPRKPIRLVNNTKHFKAGVSRTHVEFPSPDTYQARSMKIEGYESRLYWQYRYCEDHDGQTYFYTLTYNDKSMPKYRIGYERDESKLPADLISKPKSSWTREDWHRRALLIDKCPWKAVTINCFDYEDLRDLLTGGFRKKLLRQYGTTFKYFIGAELGDGKGERGMHNNPHYHVLFFLEPANNPRYPYVKIFPEQFRYLVKTYWQGFDENIDGRRDYRTAKYGIAKEGEPDDLKETVTFGRVINFRACMYCAKYVCKDANLRMAEDAISRRWRAHYHKVIEDDYELYERFFNEILCPKYGVDTDVEFSARIERFCSDIEKIFDDDPAMVDFLVEMIKSSSRDASEELLEKVMPSSYVPERFPDWLDESLVVPDFVKDVIRYKNLWKEFRDFKRVFVEEKVRSHINEYRNRFCNKCRISHGVGDYALDFVDLENPSVQVPTNKGFKSRPLCLYYYRKIFTDVVKDEAGQNIHVLNDLGLEYKCSCLEKRLCKKEEIASGYLDALVGNRSLYEKMQESDVCEENCMSYNNFLKNLNYLLSVNNLQQILRCYAEYKIIYEDRWYKAPSFGPRSRPIHPDIDPVEDYRRFNVPTFGSVRRRDNRVAVFLKRHTKDWHPYSEHPYFLRYIGIFNVFDCCSYYFFEQEDIRKQKDAEERAAVKRFHSQQKMKDFYASFGL